VSEREPHPPDLRWHVERAIGFIERWAAPLAGVDPVRAIAGGTDAYSSEDLAHNIGRSVDGLVKGGAATGRPVNVNLLQSLRSMLFASTDNDVGFPAAYCRTVGYYYDGSPAGMFCGSHNVREAVQAFLELHMRDGDPEAKRRLDRLLESLLRITDANGRYVSEEVEKHALLKSGMSFYDDKMHGAMYRGPVQDRGRLIMALTQVYRALGDTRAMELAQRFVRLIRSRTFTADGHLTHFAGSHTHSITGTVHGLADWGALAGDLDTLEHARRIFDAGLSGVSSSFGWSVEGAWREKIVGRGEVNNTGDMVQTALTLGHAGWPQYFEIAERMIRSHVLPTQWLTGQEYHQPKDDPRNPPAALPDDVDGGWGCPAVNDRYGGSRFGILDITQGGIQCLWAALRKGISQEPHGHRINVLFTNEQGDEGNGGRIELTSRLPQEGRISIRTTRRENLWVHRHGWMATEHLRVTSNDKPMPVPFTDDWVIVPRVEPGTTIRLTFPVPRREQTEWVNHLPYRIVFEGNQIVAMDPKGDCAPMYPSVNELRSSAQRR